MIGGRSLGTSADCLAMSWEKALVTKSRSPAMYSAGTVTGMPAKGAINSQPRSTLRHQASGPWNPLRAYSLTYTSMSDSVTQAGKDGGSVTKPPFRGIIPGGSPPAPADDAPSPDNM